MSLPLFNPNLGVFPLDQIAHVWINLSRYLKLFGREIIFEVFQPALKTYLNVTDRQMNGQTTYCIITALCVASSGKKDASEFKMRQMVWTMSMAGLAVCQMS